MVMALRLNPVRRERETHKGIGLTIVVYFLSVESFSSSSCHSVLILHWGAKDASFLSKTSSIWTKQGDVCE